MTASILITTVGSKTANSFATSTDADSILTATAVYDTTAWTALQTAAKEFRLYLAGKILKERFTWAGWPVYEKQAMPFPRWPPDTRPPNPWRDWARYNRNFDRVLVPWDPAEDPPGVPYDMVQAQVLIAYGIVHKRLAEISNPADGPDESPDLSSLSLFGVSIGVARMPSQFVDNAELDTIMRTEHLPIYMLLQEYRSQIVHIPDPVGPRLLAEVA